MALYHAEYGGFPCMVRDVEDRQGENVLTKRGNVEARQGDYVLLNVDEAPTGYHSDRIDRVVRRNDKRLTLGELVESVSEVEDKNPSLDQVEADGPQNGDGE